MASGKLDFKDTNLDFVDEFGGFDAPEVSRPKSAREAIAMAGPSVLQGMKDSAKDPETIRDILQKALPRSFTYMLDETDRYATSYDQLQRQIGKDVRPAVTAFGKLAKRVNGMIPHPFQGKMDELFTKWATERAGEAQVDGEEAAIEAALAQAMGGGESGDLTGNAKAEKVITKIDERNYRIGMYNALSDIRTMTRQYTQYQFTQNRNYQRKVLEIQLRQLLTQRKTLEVVTKSSVETSNLLRDVVKNTGLPEYAKERANEAFRRTSREMMFGAVQRPIADWSRNYVRNVGRNLGLFATDKMRNFREGAQNAEEALAMLESQMAMAKEMGVSPLQVMSEMGGDALFKMLGGAAAEKFGKYMPFRGKADNFFSYLVTQLRNLPGYLNDVGRKHRGGSSFLDQLLSNFAVGVDKDSNQVLRGSALKGTSGMSIDLRNNRALEEIIPGYLSRMLHIMEKTYTGNPDLPRTVFNREKGTFTTLKQSASDLEKAIVSTGALRGQAADLNALMDSMGVSESDYALRAVLGRHLMRQSEDPGAFNVEDYLNKDVEGVTNRQKSRLKKSLIETFGLRYDDEKGKYVSGLGANNIKILDAQDRYRRLQQGHISLYNMVQAAMNTGNHDELAELGIIRYDPDIKGWVINDQYKQGRIDTALVSEMTGRDLNHQDYKPKPNAAASDILNDIRSGGRDKESVSGGERISGGAARSIRGAIRSQTEELVANLQELIQHASQQNDTLEDIAAALEDGIDVNGFGVSVTGGKIGRGIKNMGRGAWWGAKKLWNVTGYPFRGAKWLGSKTLSPLWRGAKNWVAGKDFKGKIDKLKTDVYVMGANGFRKALDAVGFEEGRYTNMSDGSPIRTIRDIKGAVYDNVLQRQIISQEEFDNGLLNSVGKRIFGGALGLATTMVGKATKIAFSPITWAWRQGKRLTQGLASTFMAPPDIYVPGETSPRILGTLMFTGNTYYSGNTGKPLKYLGDIDGEIVTFDKLTGERKVIITQQEVMDGLVDSKGKPLTPFFRKIKNLIDSAKTMIGKAWRAPKAIWDWAKRQVKAGGALLGRGLSGLLSSYDNKLTQVYWLERIYKLMYLKYTGRTIKSDKDLATAMESIASRGAEKVSKAATRTKEKVKEKVKEKIKKAGESDSAKRAKAVKDRLMGRAGSWVNEMMETKVKPKRETLSRTVEEARKDGQGWMGALFKGLSAVFGASLAAFGTSIMKKFGWLKDILTSKLPFWMLKSATVASGEAAAGDVAGSMVGGRWGGRLKKWGNLAKTSKLGRLAGKLGRFGGGILRTAGVTAAASAATSAVTSGTAAAAASTVASTAAAGGGLLASAASGLVAVGSFLLSPWVLGAVALGAGLYGAYKLYKYFSKKSDFALSEKLRLVQYGFQLDRQHDACAKVLALEAQLQEAVRWESGKVSFDSRKIDLNSIADLFGVTRGAGRQFNAMTTWLTRRFLPIYAAWLTAAKNNGNADSLDKLDTRVAPAVMRSIITGSYLGDIPDQSSPYWVAESPIPGYWCIQGKQRIDDAMKSAMAQLETDVGKFAGRAQTARTLGAAEGFNAPSDRIIHGKSLVSTQPGQDPRLDNYYGAAERLTKGKITGNIISDAVIAKFNEIDDLTALRMKVYGLTKLQKVYVDTLRRFELEMAKAVSYDPKGQVRLAFSGGSDIFRQYGGMFGLDPSDKQSGEVFVYWVEKRFIPAFSTFMAATHQIDPNGDPFTAYARYKGAELLQVGTAISTATTAAPDGRRYSVWNVDAVPFAGESANLNSSSADINLEAFRQAAKNDTYNDSKAPNKNRLTTAGASLVTNKLQSLASDLAKATGNTSAYTFQNNANNSYSQMNNMTTSWQSAGFGNQSVSNVKLNGSAKQRGEALMKAAVAAGISGDELALFMGTCAEESGDFSDYVENSPDVARYARNPNLGNNGSIETARKYIGRGPMQLTGLTNYQNMARWLGVDVVSRPELLEDTTIGANSAVAYWINYVRPLVKRKGRQLDPLTVSAATNGWYEDPNGPGGLREPNGYEVRLRKMQQWAAIINGKAPDPTAGGMGEANTAAAANQSGAQPNGNGASDGTPSTPTTPQGGSGGQQVAPAPATVANGSPSALINPPGGRSTTGGQEVAPAAPSALLARAGTPSSSSAPAPSRQSVATQQRVNTEVARGKTLPEIAMDSYNVLVEIRDAIKNQRTAPTRGSANTPIGPSNQTNNKSPNAPVSDGAPISEQSTPNETAIKSRPQMPAASAQRRQLPVDVSH